MSGPAAALFDFDGTLIDREPLVGAAVERALAAAGTAPPEGSMVIGRAWQDLHVALGVGPALGWSVADLVERTRAEVPGLLAEGHTAELIAGGAALIERLAASGVAVAIVSGSLRAEILDGVDLLGIGDHLDLVLGAEDYGPGKPHPECFLTAAERLAVDPRRCVVFEDSVVGIDAGLAAGMGVVAVAQSIAPPGHPHHQDQGAAHRVVRDHHDVTDDLLAAVLAEVAADDPGSAR